MTNTDKMRNDFEEHLTRDVSGLCAYAAAIQRHPDGDYVSTFSQERWVDWQAATLKASKAREAEFMAMTTRPMPPTGTEGTK